MPVAAILAIIEAAAQIVPALAEAAPIIRTALTGGAVSNADLATLEATAEALNAQAAALGG